jgi:ABC-type dipeptide/oligopeptide/nickel transport system permease component
VLLQKNWEFSFTDFFAYIKASLAKGSLGFSDFEYPQTVQHFVLTAFPHSFYKFLLILAICFCTFGIFLFFSTVKKKLNSKFSQFSVFLRMDKAKILRQARIAALPGQALLWSFFAPAIFIVLLLLEAKFGIPGLGSTIKIAYNLNDFPLLYGSSLCVLAFALFANIFFLTLKIILSHK